jgi:2-phospho-L-lactate guanylyltransferase
VSAVQRAGVLIPVKAFHEAKVRLAPALDPRARARLARAMAATVVRAAGGLPTWVVCDDEEVAAWATDVGTEVLWRPGLGLNGAVTDGVAALAGLGVERAVVAHADLPHALDVTWAARTEGVVLVPDRHDDGTNVVALPTGCGFTFAYGPGSFRRHEAAAHSLGLAVQVVRDERLMWDIDVPDDLEHPPWEGGTTSAERPEPQATA